MIDFIDVQWWPVFNVADMGVVIGGLLLVRGRLAERARAGGLRSSAVTPGRRT